MLETLLQPNDKLERCGLLMKDGTVVEIENIAEQPELGYEMNPVPVIPLMESGNVVASWHTHPDADPNLSEEDRIGFLSWPDIEHIIIGRRNGEVVETRYKVEEGMVLICD